MSDNKIKILSIVGPTASGKTSLSIHLAKKLSGEIVSADSMQIYKGMDIATAKPDMDERMGIPHHLMDYVEVGEPYSVARYISDADDVIRDIVKRGNLPILTGGTGLYVDSLLNGIQFTEGEVDFKLRSELQDKFDAQGLDALLEELDVIDSETASKLSIERNPKRIIRALEIYYTTGITMSEQNRLSKQNGSLYEPVKIALTFRDRQKLYDRINLRVDLMLEKGLVKEAQNFYLMPQGNTSKQAIGYKELLPYLEGEKSLDECIETLKRSTRRYAKRQLTWFNRDDDIKWFYKDDYETDDIFYLDVLDYLTQKGFVFNEKN